MNAGSVFPCFRKNLIRFNCSSDIFSALGSFFHIRSGGFLPSSVIALTTHALAFEDLVALDVPCDLGIITGNCGLVFTAALLCLHLLFTNIDPLNRRPESGEFWAKFAVFRRILSPNHSCKGTLATMDHPEARDHDTDGISVIFPSVVALDRNRQSSRRNQHPWRQSRPRQPAHKTSNLRLKRRVFRLKRDR